MRLVSVTEVVGEDGVPNLGTRVEVTTVDGRELTGELIPDDSTYGWDWDGVVANLYRMAPEIAVPRDGLDALVATVSRLTELPELTGLTAGTVAVTT
jgi:hypothetical protein